MFNLFKKKDNEQGSKKEKNSCCNIEFEELPEELMDTTDKKPETGKKQKKCCR